MRSLPLDGIEEKARSYQIASAVAYKYANVFVYAPEQRKDAQDIQRITSAAARRYLWAAIDRQAVYRRFERDMLIDWGAVAHMEEPERVAYLSGDWGDEGKGSTP